jgi:hypothetical protein
MKKTLIALSAAAAMMTSTLSTPVMAQKTMDLATIYKTCGLGGAVFPNDGVIAAVTNLLTTLGALAVTSGLSSPDVCSGKSVKTAAFIYNSHAALEQDIAAGQGEHLAALGQISGCSTAGLRTQMVSMPAGETAMQRSENLYRALQNTCEG